jgi:hypothetical protein
MLLNPDFIAWAKFTWPYDIARDLRTCVLAATVSGTLSAVVGPDTYTYTYSGTLDKTYTRSAASHTAGLPADDTFSIGEDPTIRSLDIRFRYSPGLPITEEIRKNGDLIDTNTYDSNIEFGLTDEGVSPPQAGAFDLTLAITGDLASLFNNYSALGLNRKQVFDTHTGTINTTPTGLGGATTAVMSITFS